MPAPSLSDPPGVVHGLLTEVIAQVATVVRVPLDDVVARLHPGRGEVVLYLDIDSPPDDHCWAMLGVLSVLALGTDADARPAPHLRAVAS